MGRRRESAFGVNSVDELNGRSQDRPIATFDISAHEA